MGERNFSVDARLSDFIDRQVESGRHETASDVVGEALRRYQEQLSTEAIRNEAIRAVADAGRAAIARGDCSLVRGEEEAAGLLRRLGQRASERVRRSGAGKLG